MKYARIVRLFAERVHLSYEDALGFFYDSETYGLINDGVADMHCMSAVSYTHLTLPTILRV